jgi:PAS domain S-box-containing protein
VADDASQHPDLVEFRRLVLGVRDYAIFMLSPAGEIQSWNTGAERLKGYTAGEVVGQHFSVFYTDEDRAANHPAHVLGHAVADGRYEEEGWRVRKDGTTFWARVTITAIRDDNGELTGFAKVTRDLTERKRADEALEVALEELRVANAELDRFAAIAAHDMTDPLRTIAGFAELLRSGDLADQQAAEYAGHIHASAVRLTEMLHGLLAYARAGRDDTPSTPVDLTSAAADVVSDLASLIEEHNATVDITFNHDGTPMVLANPTDVKLILQNLVANAIRFGDPDRPQTTISAQPDDDGRLRTTVADNGPGIASEHHERIFGAFERAPSAQHAGYGLGLAICQRLVTRHGGQIGLDSQPGVGSRFWFTLPTRTIT